MNVISRIQFPRTPETSGLYMKCDEGASINFCAQQADVVLTKNGVLSLNTYFNSFYENLYAKYTELSSLYYVLRLEGDFQVSLYREHYGEENRELIYKANLEKCELVEPIKIVLPNSWQSENASRVYLEIACLSERGSFTEGYIATAQNPLREVSLGIISCTFKKEAYIKKTLETILKDNLLQGKKLKLFVVDNAKTLNQGDFSEENVEIIPNRNVGGSGGFTRGIIQAMQEDIYTHFLFMDDDIELESESIFRLFTLYEYAKQDFAISGSMFDLHKKYILHEAGAIYGKYYQNGNYIYNPFTVVPLQNKLNLEDSTVNNLFLGEDKPDYGGFWFFAFSKKVIDEMGLPMPFFIKLDDIEFSLRIKERLGQPIVAFPGIAVWHEPFYAKHSVWDTYYWIRNHLITHSTRNSLRYLDAVNFLTKDLIHKLFIFDYNSAEMVLKAFEDYMKGPLLIESNDPETIHASILKLAKIHKSQSIQSNSQLDTKHDNKLNSVETTTKDFPGKKLLGRVTLNGHLLPSFLLSNESTTFRITSEESDWWPKVFAKKRILVFREGNSSVSQHDMSRSVGIGILIRWFQLIINSARRWSSVKSEWRDAFSRLTSTDFWTKYLKLNEQS